MEEQQNLLVPLILFWQFYLCSLCKWAVELKHLNMFRANPTVRIVWLGEHVKVYLLLSFWNFLECKAPLDMCKCDHLLMAMTTWVLCLFNSAAWQLSLLIRLNIVIFWVKLFKEWLLASNHFILIILLQDVMYCVFMKAWSTACSSLNSELDTQKTFTPEP